MYKETKREQMSAPDRILNEPRSEHQSQCVLRREKKSVFVSIVQFTKVAISGLEFTEIMMTKLWQFKYLAGFQSPDKVNMDSLVSWSYIHAKPFIFLKHLKLHALIFLVHVLLQNKLNWAWCSTNTLSQSFVVFFMDQYYGFVVFCSYANKYYGFVKFVG